MAGDYKVGMVAEILAGGGKSSKGKLSSLFTAPKDASVRLAPPVISQAQRKKIRTQSSGNMEGFKPPAGIVHESLGEADEKSTEKRKRPADDDVDDDSDDDDNEEKKNEKRLRRDRLKKVSEKRTIFVGNVPLTTDKKKLVKLFKEFGEIQSVRFRCAPIKDPGTKKKVAVITKTFHDKRNNISSYICFKEEEAAKKALALNGHLVDGLHLRVDSAKPKLKDTTKRSIFVGNLSFDIEEEAIRSHFEDCGEIENVRVIRDRKTNLGKGFCYILFKSQDSVSLAQKLKNSELKKRQLRIERCMDPSKTDAKSKSKNTNKTDPKRKDTSKSQSKRKDTTSAVSKQTATAKKGKPKNKMWGPTNASGAQGGPTQNSALKRKQRRAEKKKKQKSKMSEVTRVLGPMQQPPAKTNDRQSKMKKMKKGVKGSKVKKNGRRV